MEIKTIGIACDHAGFPLKQYVLQYLEEHGYPYKDYGTYSDQSSDYPDFAHALAKGIESGEVYPGIGICGSGEGIAMTLNKHQGVRAGLAWMPEIAQLIRQMVSSQPRSKVGVTSIECRRSPLQNKVALQKNT